MRRNGQLPSNPAPSANGQWLPRTRLEERYGSVPIIPRDPDTGMPDLAADRTTLSEYLRRPSVYVPSSRLLRRVGTRAANACGPDPMGGLVTTLVKIPCSSGIQPLFGRRPRQPLRSAPNLLLTVPAPLWGLLTRRDAETPEEGAAICGKCSPDSRPANSATECASQIPPTDEPKPTVEPPQILNVAQGDPGAHCSSHCGATSLGGLTIRAKLATDQPPSPRCDQKLTFEDQYTPTQFPARPGGTGKAGSSSPCPCECKCMVEFPIFPGGGAWDLGGAIQTVVSWVDTGLEWLKGTLGELGGALIPDLIVRNEGHVSESLAAAGSASPALDQLRQGETQGLGTDAGWEADIGLMRPPISQTSSPPLLDGLVATIAAPDHPDSTSSTRIPVLEGHDPRISLPD